MSSATSPVLRYEPCSDDATSKNRRIRRYVNVATFVAAKRREGNDVIVRRFVCECGRVDCDELVAMPLAGFEAASRAGPLVAHH
jgi:hypothetical protein